MLRNALYVVSLAALLLAGCKSCTLQQAPPPAAPAPAPVVVAPTPPAAPPTTPVAAPPKPVASGPYEVLALTAQLPPDVMEKAKGPAGCPSSFLMALFGFEWREVHGCVVGKINPGGLAESVGLKTGDSFVKCNGKDISCPSSFEPTVRESLNGPDPGKLILLIHRPRTDVPPAMMKPAPAPPAK